MPAVNFTPEAANRIIAATRKVERTPTSLVGDRNPAAPSDIEFWAWLSSPGGWNGLFWSWVRVQPIASLPTSNDPPTMEDSPLFEFAEPLVSGYLNAREVSNTRNVPPETVVRMVFIGYGRDGEPQYGFSYAAPDRLNELPIHDHRDNLNGGFAFSVYHPGSDLPQQPWHV